MWLIFSLISILHAVTGSIITVDVTRPPSILCGFGNLTFYNHTPFSYLIMEPELCYGDVFILNYVQSSSGNFDKRKVIRETWGSLRLVNNNPVRLIFVIGQPKDPKLQTEILKESDSYRDIVQGDFLDSYWNLTLKHIVALHWINKFCSHAQFVSKTDDDVFINVFLLAFYLKKNFNPQQKSILGQISYDEVPLRQPHMKWTVTTDMYHEEKYPHFMKGFAYVVFQAAIEPLFVCSYYQKFFYIDDIFITGLVTRLANVSLVNFQRFYGHIWISKENITLDMMENLFFVSQTEYHEELWKSLWDTSLKMEL